MNTFWTLPTAAEIAIFALCLAIGVICLRLPLRSAALALLLMCPVPLAYLVSGGNSAIYASDILGVLCLFWLLLPGKGLPSVFSYPTSRAPAILASLLLIVLPSVSTAMGAALTGRGDWKLIALGVFRGCAYTGLFCAAIQFGRRGEEISKLVAIQCVAFTLICGCGILQTAIGLDLTLPSPATSVLQGDLGGDTSAAGFMGLYRGAIGAWGPAVLGAIPLVLFRRRLGYLIAPVCMAVVLAGIILTASRQGLVIGLVAAGLGTLAALASARRWAPGSFRTVIAVSALFLGGLCLVPTVAPAQYDQWLNGRFSSLLDLNTIGEQIASRDDRMGYAINRWLTNKTAFQFLGAGRGRLSDGITTYEGEVGYVDSEIVWQLQENGVVAVIAYLIFLICLASRLRIPKRATESTRETILIARIALISGTLLIYGHFFLLSVQYAQAPATYWNWALFGAAIGTVIRARCSSQLPLTPNASEFKPWPNRHRLLLQPKTVVTS